MKKILTLLVCFYSFQLYAQIDECTGYQELYRGRHKINGMTYGHPYTTFDRHNGKSLEQTIELIRIRIKQEKFLMVKPVFDAYKTVYDNADTPPRSRARAVRVSLHFFS